MEMQENGQERLKFAARIEQMPQDVQDYYAQLRAILLSYKVKSRASARCDSYRASRKLLAKIAIGGKTLKLYLAMDADDPDLADGKYHQRNLSSTKAYQEVPFMLPIRSQLAVRKAAKVIDKMMIQNGLGLDD